METKGDFDSNVASMRPKMGEAKEELEEEKLMFPFFTTPRKIIDEFRAFELKAKEEAKSAQNGKPEESAQGGATGGAKKKVNKDDKDDMSVKSQA